VDSGYQIKILRIFLKKIKFREMGSLHL